MSTEHRDKLASSCAMFVPLALDEIGNAERLVTEGKASDALKYIREAREHLRFLTPLFDAACDEAQAR
jgi:hypothetical protein